MANKSEIERVNSFHHQALKQVAKGLKVVAIAPAPFLSGRGNGG